MQQLSIFFNISLNLTKLKVILTAGIRIKNLKSLYTSCSYVVKSALKDNSFSFLLNATDFFGHLLYVDIVIFRQRIFLVSL